MSHVQTLIIAKEAWQLEAIKTVLSADDRIRVVGQAQSAIDAPQASVNHHPNLVVICLDDALTQILRSVAAIKRMPQTPRVILVGDNSHLSMICAMSLAGADAFLLFVEMKDRILNVVNQVLLLSPRSLSRPVQCSN